SSGFVAGLVATADRQQSVVLESARTEVTLKTAQIAGRDLRKAQAADQVDAQLQQLDQVTVQARDRIAALEAIEASADTRKKFERISELTLSYVTALRQIGTKQNEILALFKKLDEAEVSWTRAFNRLVNSDTFSLMPNGPPIEALINEAGSAFKDART